MKVHESIEKTTSARNRILRVETDELELWAAPPFRQLSDSRPGLAFTASPCNAWQVARDRWHLLEKARLRFHRRQRSVPSKARPTMLAFPSYYYRKRGSASYIVREVLSVREREREIQRERERDGSDVTIVALKLARWTHFHLPKIRTIGDELTLSLAKNSHFSFLPSHFPSLPSRRGHHCGAEIRNEFTLSIAKNFFARFVVPPLSNGTSRTTSDRKPKTNDQILPSPILFFPSKNWIKLIPKTIGNRKRDCAWGGSGW